MFGWEPPKPHNLPSDWLLQCPADAVPLKHHGSWRGEPLKAAPYLGCGWQAMLSSYPESCWCSKKPSIWMHKQVHLSRLCYRSARTWGWTQHQPSWLRIHIQHHATGEREIKTATRLQTRTRGAACTLCTKVQGGSKVYKPFSKGFKPNFAAFVSKHHTPHQAVLEEEVQSTRGAGPPSAQLHCKGHSISQLSERICSCLSPPEVTERLFS